MSEPVAKKCKVSTEFETETDTNNSQEKSVSENSAEVEQHTSASETKVQDTNLTSANQVQSKIEVDVSPEESARAGNPSLVSAKSENECDGSKSNSFEDQTEVPEVDDFDASNKTSSSNAGSLNEVQAGITEFVGDHSGFSAIIKQRYSDFIVNEIDQEGNIVHLTDLILQPDEDEEEIPQDEANKNQSDIISLEDLAQLKKLSEATDKSGSVCIDAPEDKDKRSKIHLSIKRNFPQFETKTVEDEGKKLIKVEWQRGSSNRRSNEMQWPASKKSFPYVKFVLYKENKDTMDAIGLMAKNLRVKDGLFQYAGTKDRRAKTTQEVTAHKIHPKKLVFLNKVLYNIGIGNFRYVKEPLKLGQLKGNHFTIVLRNVQGSEEKVDRALNSLKSQGFINYFGLQRFGTTSVPTFEIGRALLKGDWNSAIDLILKPRNDHPDKDKFQTVWADTKDPSATLKVLPRYCGLERKLLEALKKKMSPLNSLEKIARNTRLLYVHSYQSRIWNMMASRRLKELGHKVVVGDLVLKQAEPDAPLETETGVPVAVTSENLADFTLKDVVLPLPGHDILYPQNEVHAWYQELLEKDGLDINNMKRPQKDYSLPGAYRHLVVFPSQVTWQHWLYDDYTVPLTLSDLDKIKGQVTLPKNPEEGKMKAVVLEMSLPQSCYATMALREILRQDTSTGHQASLNVT